MKWRVSDTHIVFFVETSFFPFPAEMLVRYFYDGMHFETPREVRWFLFNRHVLLKFKFVKIIYVI